MNADQLIEEIVKIVNLLSEQDMDEMSGDTLSRVAVKLASYKASLGTFRTQARRAVWDAEKSYELAKAEGYKAMRAEGTNSTDSKEMKKLRAADEMTALADAREMEVKVVGLSNDIHDLIDAIKGRVIHLQTERSENRVG